MTLPELIDSLIELSTEEMPDEARKSLDDAIDHIVSNMTEQELHGVLDEAIFKNAPKHHTNPIFTMNHDVFRQSQYYLPSLILWL